MKKILLLLITLCLQNIGNALEIKPSTVSQSPEAIKERERDISDWVEVRGYQKYFDKHFRKSKYPIYIESDELGRRRMIWVERPSNINVGVKTNRTKEEIERLHKEKSSQGKTLLAIYEFKMGEIKTYNLVWIENKYISEALEDLDDYGITQAKLIK